MRKIVTHQDNFHYMKFQPGDGTVYTVLWGNMFPDEDNLYIALGSADYIRGGYFFRQSSARELAREMVKWIENETASLPAFVQDYHLFSYHHTKFDVFDRDRKPDWTLAVIVLFSVILTLGDPTMDEDLEFISHVYRDNSQEALDTLYRWNITGQW
jgi:hypothetical protein